MQYLYHRVPPVIVGDKLVPLNQLKDIDTSAYESAKSKYVGREETMLRKIAPLDCLWNDVLFLSAVHPSEIKALYEQTQHRSLRPQSYFVIDPTLLTESTAIWWWGDDFERRMEAENFEQFDPKYLDELAVIPERTRTYYSQQYDKGERPLLWFYVPHILYKGALPIQQLEIINV